MFLRVTWHSEHSAFVVSHWDRDVCVAATRVAATDVADLVSLLANGLADGLETAVAKPPFTSTAPTGSRRRRWQQMLQRFARRRTRADVISFPERATATSADDLRWKRHHG
jgi:hypothetical protein